MTARTAAELAGIEVGRGSVRVDLLTDNGVTSVALPLDAASHRALPAVLTLHGHGRGCPGQVDVHVGLLLRVLHLAATGTPELVLRPRARPPVSLRLSGAAGVEVALGTLDACCLLCSCRVPIRVDAGS